MTIQKYCLEKLEEKGLWLNEAELVLEKAKVSPILKPMENRWLESFEDHALVVIVLTLMAVETVAKEWLQENAPEHFALKNFTK